MNLLRKYNRNATPKPKVQIAKEERSYRFIVGPGRTNSTLPPKHRWSGRIYTQTPSAEHVMTFTKAVWDAYKKDHAYESDEWDELAKSLSETASILLDIGLSKPSLSDVKNRSIGNEVPAKAADPNGHSFNLFFASVNLSLSLSNISI